MRDKASYQPKLKSIDLKLIRIYLSEGYKQQWIARQISCSQPIISYHKRKMEEELLNEGLCQQEK